MGRVGTPLSDLVSTLLRSSHLGTFTTRKRAHFSHLFARMIEITMFLGIFSSHARRDFE
jgi:hypothetical protein